jgi:A/G-specific adenine glycosylase
MKELHDWFLENQRSFPWRENPNPYRVWVSEVMLQQTRAIVVVPYFERWMALFPDVAALAAAPLEKVIKVWEGLGYYSRARNLHKGACQVMELFNGVIPGRREDLESIRGLGPYTVGAILSFGFRQRAAAVDGNVTRVLSRLFLIEENVCKSATKVRIAREAEDVLDTKEPWVTAEALIELGATVCTPRPRCEECPVQKKCLARLEGKAEALPIKNEEKAVTELKRVVVVIEAEGKVLVRKGEAGKVMADLYEFPYFEVGKEVWTQRRIVAAVKEQFGIESQVLGKLDEVTHTFTRYKARLYPYRLKTDRAREVDGHQWVDRLNELPFSSGHRKIGVQCTSFI